MSAPLRQLVGVWLIGLAATLSCPADEGDGRFSDGDHASVLKHLGAPAKPLPKVPFALLSGNGLNRNIILRQAEAGGVQYTTVLNPAWWPVTVTLKLDCRDDVLCVTQVENGTSQRSQCTNKEKAFTIELAPHQAAVITMKPPAPFLSAETRVPDAVRRDVADRLMDLTVALPHLPTRRPDLLAGNPGFEKVDYRKIPTQWKVFEWHKKKSLFGPDTLNVREGKQSFFMDNTEHGKTVGIVSDRFRVHPGRGYTFAVNLGSDARPSKARIAFTGKTHLAKEVSPDNVWREFSLALSPDQSTALAPSGAARVEVHNDAKGVLWMDDARVVDSTLTDLKSARAIELLAKRLAAAYAEGDMVDCCTVLEEAPLKALLAKVARMRKGTEWLVVGPFASASDADLAKALPPEKEVFAGKNLRGLEYSGRAAQKVAWVTAWADAEGYLDLCGAVGPFDKCIAYAYASVHSSINQKATLLVGSDDGIAVWVNRKPAHLHAGSRSAKPGEDSTDADLKSGWNDILVKVRNESSNWGFFLSLADENRRPLRNVRFARRLLGQDRSPSK